MEVSDSEFDSVSDLDLATDKKSIETSNSILTHQKPVSEEQLQIDRPLSTVQEGKVLLQPRRKKSSSTMVKEHLTIKEEDDEIEDLDRLPTVRSNSASSR